MLTIKIAAKTSKPVGAKPQTFPFRHGETLTGENEYQQAKRYAVGQLASTGRSWVSVESGKCLYLVGYHPDGSLYEWERKPDEPAQAA